MVPLGLKLEIDDYTLRNPDRCHTYMTPPGPLRPGGHSFNIDFNSNPSANCLKNDNIGAAPPAIDLA